MGLLNKFFGLSVVAVATLTINPIFISDAYAAVQIDRARWDSDRNRLTVRGTGDGNQTVTVTNADTGALVGSDQVDGGDWRVRVTNPASVPCRVRATQSNGDTDVRDVSSAPADCDDGGGAPPPGGGADLPIQTDFKIMMNYELGMHCTGFEFAYCCVLPAYNSILAQVVKPEGTDGADFPELLEGDPNNGRDGLNRETVLRDKALDGSGNFKKYVLRYWHDAQPRNDGRGKAQPSTLISAVEGNSLMSWNTVFDSVERLPDGSLRTGTYNGSDGVMLGDGSMDGAADNYQNAIWNHLYFYRTWKAITRQLRLEADKIRLGVNGQVVYPTDCGPALHPMGPQRRMVSR